MFFIYSVILFYILTAKCVLAIYDNVATLPTFYILLILMFHNGLKQDCFELIRTVSGVMCSWQLPGYLSSKQKRIMFVYKTPCPAPSGEVIVSRTDSQCSHHWPHLKVFGLRNVRKIRNTNNVPCLSKSNRQASVQTYKQYLKQ